MMGESDSEVCGHGALEASSEDVEIEERYPLDYSCVCKEAQDQLSKNFLGSDLLAEHSYHIESLEGEKWQIQGIPHEEQVYQYTLERFSFYVYSMMLSKIGVRPPFRKFEQVALNRLRLVPTQLHPISWAFLRAFSADDVGFGFHSFPSYFHHSFQCCSLHVSWLGVVASHG